MKPFRFALLLLPLLAMAQAVITPPGPPSFTTGTWSGRTCPAHQVLIRSTVNGGVCLQLSFGDLLGVDAAAAAALALKAPLASPVFTGNVTVGTTVLGAPPKFAAALNAVFEGDSITAGLGLAKSADNTPACRTSLADATCLDWPSKLSLMSGLQPWLTAKRNFAVSGNVVADMQSRYTASVHPFAPSVTGVRALLTVFIGTNNIAILGDSSATIISQLTTYWAGAKADGFTLLAATIPAFGNFTSAAQHITRAALNDFIRASVSAGLVDYLFDADKVLTSPYNTTFFQADVLHPTAVGAFSIARAVNAVLWADGNPVAADDFVGVPGNMQLLTGGTIFGDGNMVVGPNPWLQLSNATGSVLNYGTGANTTKLIVASNLLGAYTNNALRWQVVTTLQIFPLTADPGCTITGHIGRIWFDNTTTTTALKFCLNVAGTMTWVAK